jgi:hypothetical protein
MDLIVQPHAMDDSKQYLCQQDNNMINNDKFQSMQRRHKNCHVTLTGMH